IPFSAFIQIDRAQTEPIYLQIVYQFINAVKTNLLEADDQLPGSRIIAKELNIHRKTVVAALSELQEQGWLNIIPNVGAFVTNPEQATPAQQSDAFQQPLKKAQFTFRREFISN